jgi:hypothetical protein
VDNVDYRYDGVIDGTVCSWLDCDSQVSANRYEKALFRVMVRFYGETCIIYHVWWLKRMVAHLEGFYDRLECGRLESVCKVRVLGGQDRAEGRWNQVVRGCCRLRLGIQDSGIFCTP